MPLRRGRGGGKPGGEERARVEGGMASAMKPNASGKFLVGVDIGGTNVRAGLVDRAGRLVADARRPARALEGPPATLAMVAEAISEAIEKGGAKVADVCGIGMGVPGRHNSRAGICLFSPNFTGWVNVKVVEPIAKEFGLATYMLNDVKTATLGEHRFGAGKGFDHVVMITLGTGIGCGVISDGQLRLGSGEGFSEAGHMCIDVNGPLCTCGSRGCWEALAGRDAIIRMAIFQMQSGQETMLAEHDEVTPAAIAEAAEKGDALAQSVMRHLALYVGVGVSNLVQLYNPQVIIIGGGIAQAGDILFEPIQRVVNTRAHMVPASTCEIRPAALGDDAGIIGGAVLVLREMEKQSQ